MIQKRTKLKNGRLGHNLIILRNKIRWFCINRIEDEDDVGLMYDAL